MRGRGATGGGRFKAADDGADIAVMDISGEEVEAVAGEAGAAGRRATVCKAHESNRDEIYASVAHTEKELGGFDIIVKNAGDRSNPADRRRYARRIA